MQRERPAASTGPQTWAINKWLAFFIVAIGMFIATLDAGVVGVSIPKLVIAFHTNASTILWVNLIYFIVGVGLMPTMGWLGDKKGRRRVFVLAFILFTVGLIISTFSQNVYQLIAARFVQGAGNSMLMSNGLAIIAQSFPRNERGKAFGLNGAVLGLGLAGGPAIGGVLLDAFEWQSLFYTRIPFALLGIALAWRFLPKDSQQSGPLNLDFWGAAALFASTGAFLFALSEGSRYGFVSPVVISAAAASIVFIAAFIWRENTASNPVVGMSLFKIRRFRVTLVLHVMHYLIVGSVAFLVPFYLINGLGYSSSKTGLFVAIFFALRLPFAPTSGWLSDRFGYAAISMTGLAIAALGAFLLSRLGTGGTELTIALSLLLAGLGCSMFEPTNSTGIMGALKQDQLGLGSAAVSMGRQIGLATGTALGGAIYILREAAYSTSLQAQGVVEEIAKTTAVAKGFQDALLVIVVLVALSLFLPFVDRNRRANVAHDQKVRRTS